MNSLTFREQHRKMQFQFLKMMREKLRVRILTMVLGAQPFLWHNYDTVTLKTSECATLLFFTPQIECQWMKES